MLGRKGATKHCCYRMCNSDSRYSHRDYMDGVAFCRFPNPIKEPERAKRWAGLCGRSDFTAQSITKDTYICSRHFESGDFNSEPTVVDPCKGNIKLKEQRKRKLMETIPSASVSSGDKKLTLKPVVILQNIGRSWKGTATDVAEKPRIIGSIAPGTKSKKKQCTNNTVSERGVTARMKRDRQLGAVSRQQHGVPSSEVGQLKRELERLQRRMKTDMVWCKTLHEYVESIRRTRSEQVRSNVGQVQRIMGSSGDVNNSKASAPARIKVEEHDNNTSEAINRNAAKDTDIVRTADSISEAVETEGHPDVLMQIDGWKELHPAALVMTPPSVPRSASSATQDKPQQHAKSLKVINPLMQEAGSEGHQREATIESREPSLPDNGHKELSVCDSCSKTYGRKYLFPERKSTGRAGTGSDQGLCRSCLRKFSSAQHVNERWSLQARAVYGCSGCKACFMKVSDLRRHLPCPSSACDETDRFLCLLCDRMFPSGAGLQRHVAASHS